MIRYNTKKDGFALLLAIIISSVVLAIGVTILKVSVNQINLSATARESEFAFQAAHAGLDCITFWRNQNAAIYTNRNSAAPLINCFNGNLLYSTKASYTPTNGVGTTDNHFINSYEYAFDWGNPVRCTWTRMYIMKATDAPVTLNFGSRLPEIGTNGVKTCALGSTCTVIISSGVNRPCNDWSTSIFAVQRELTAEF